MATRYTIRFDDVHQQTGKRSLFDYEPSIKPKLFPADRKYGFVLYWSRKVFPYLDISARLARSETSVAVNSGIDAYRAVAGSTELNLPSQWIKAEFTGDKILAAKVDPDQRITLTITFDTDHPKFCEYAQSRIEATKNLPPERRGVAIGIRGYLLSGTANEEILLVLAVRPGTEPTDFDGFVGLDLGNFHTALAYLDPRLGVADVQMIGDTDVKDIVKKGPDVEAVRSPVVIEAVHGGIVTDRPESVKWRIGEDANVRIRQTMDGVELAPKRQAVSSEYDQERIFRVSTRLDRPSAADEDVQLKRRLPAELLACRMFQNFRAATGRTPIRVAMSYPTACSESQLSQLREVGRRGFMRMIPETGQDGKLEEFREIDNAGPGQLLRSDRNVCMMLDEASAAAFFFLHQRILGAPGKLSRFRYLYPNGLNLLIYDCGGGSTDIALVRALVKFAKNNDRLLITVRGRVGGRIKSRKEGRVEYRDFGGDTMTEVVFHVLKAKVAARIANSKGLPPFPSGESLQNLEKYLDDYALTIDQHYPTRYNPTQLSEEARKCSRRCQELWALAEEIKRAFSASSSQIIKLASTKNAINPPPQFGNDLAKWQSTLQGLSVSRDEIDCLLRPKIQQTIDVCNRLIRMKLVEKKDTNINEEHEEPEDVHWVVAAGAASQYPLVAEMLKAGLEVPFLNEVSPELGQRFTCDPKNLKNAVAKGLALALGAKFTADVTLDFDSDLSNRLPYDVIFDSAKGYKMPVFRENQHFKQMEYDVPIDAQSLPSNVAKGELALTATDVYLYRRFPGEEDPEPYVRFRFVNGVKGKLKIRRDSEHHSSNNPTPYLMTDDGQEADEVCYLTTPDRFVHPIQRGDL